MLDLEAEGNTVFIEGNVGDTLTLLGFEAGGQEMVDIETYDRYIAPNSDAVVLVDQEVGVALF